MFDWASPRTHPSPNLHLRINGAEPHLGAYETEDGAARAYDARDPVTANGGQRCFNFPAPTAEMQATQHNPPTAEEQQKPRAKYTGVTLDNRRSKPWLARTTWGGVSISLGYHDTEEEAARAYDAEVCKHPFTVDGQRRHLNFPSAEEQATREMTTTLAGRQRTPRTASGGGGAAAAAAATVAAAGPACSPTSGSQPARKRFKDTVTLHRRPAGPPPLDTEPMFLPNQLDNPPRVFAKLVEDGSGSRWVACVPTAAQPQAAEPCRSHGGGGGGGGSGGGGGGSGGGGLGGKLGFKQISRNAWHPDIKRPTPRQFSAGKQGKQGLSDGMPDDECECGAKQDKWCGSDCLNRVLLIECDRNTCPNGDRCTNRRV